MTWQERLGSLLGHLLARMVRIIRWLAVRAGRAIRAFFPWAFGHGWKRGAIVVVAVEGILYWIRPSLVSNLIATEIMIVILLLILRFAIFGRGSKAKV